MENLVNNFQIDLKFFNTYGPSRHFYYYQNDDKTGLMDKINISIHFGVKFTITEGIENAVAEVKEYMLRLLCKVHNVNYFWLVEEKGDMYLSPPEIITNEVAEKYGLDKNDISLIEEYVNLDSDVRKAIKQLIINVVKKAPDD